MQLAERSYYSISELASLLGVSRVSVWRWISSGKLPATRLGHRTVRIQRADVDRLIARPLTASQAHQISQDVSADRSESPVRPLAERLETDKPDHFVLFYDRDEFLLDSVSEFLAPALTCNQRAVVIATPAHADAIVCRLAESGVDVPAARAAGRLVLFDAQQTLGRFMVDGTPDPDRFAAVVEDLVQPTAESPFGSGMRVFGEMVALLFADGNLGAAISLERLWNLVQKQYPLALLCAYPMQELGGDRLTSALSDVCAEHAAVVPAESYSGLDDADARLREIVALQQKAASLEQALLAERAARDQAEAALQTREEFLSIASHELRTPIAVLKAQSQLSLRRLSRTGQLEPERVTHALSTMSAQANKLSRLVNQLLDSARVSAGKLDLEVEPIDLVHVIAAAVEVSRSLTDRHTISLTAPSALRWVADPLRLEQLFTNLLENAVKYSPDGGQIEVLVTEPAADKVSISIRDHGLGIPPQRRALIFDRFYQAHESSYRSGMGLGLYLCRHIVELHAGEIRAEFPQDGGTCVVVELAGGGAMPRP